MLVPIDLEDQIMKGTLEATINEAINRMDMKPFTSRIKNELTGAPAYNPRSLLKIILFAYSRGILSSRRIAEACEKHIVFMALSGYSKPNFTTIADFISSMEAEVKQVFIHILRLCTKMDLVGAERFAIDGHKLSSNAAKEHSGRFADFKKRIDKYSDLIGTLVKQHSETDVVEEKAELQRKRQRLVAKKERLEEFTQSQKPKVATRKSAKEPMSNVTDNESAKIISAHGVIQGYNGVAVTDEKMQIVVAAEAHGTSYEGNLLMHMLDLTGENLAKAAIEKTVPDVQILADANYFSEENLKALHTANIDAYIPDPMFRKRDPRFADADEHKGKTRKNVYDKKKSKGVRGFGQEDFSYDKEGDFYLCKSGHRLNRWGDHATSGGRQYGIEKIAHCRSCLLRKECMPGGSDISKKMITVASGEANSRRMPFSTLMKTKMDLPESKKIYAKRLKIIEPVFANTRAHKGMNKFTLRGKAKVNIQWLLYMAVHNLSKIANVLRVNPELQMA
jgi:transposase